MHKFSRLALLCAVGIVIAACARTQTDNPAVVLPPYQPALEVRVSNVFVAAGGNAFEAPPLPTRQPISDGDRIRTDVDGIGLLSLVCADVLVFGGSNLQLEQTGTSTLTASGAQLFSSTCGDILVRGDQVPPEAVVETHGTVFFVAYIPEKHVTLLWTLVGTATLSNVGLNGQTDQTVRVPAGFWSVTRDRGVPDIPPHPVADMGPIVDQLNLREVYDLVVQLMQTEGFGPSAPVQQNIATIVPPTATPTPTLTGTPTDSAIATLVPFVPPTNTRVRPIVPIIPSVTPLLTQTTAVPPATKAAPPQPAIAPSGPPSISFDADRIIIEQGESTALRWDVDNVRAVYLDGEGVTGHWSRTVRPQETQTYTLLVVLPDGSEQSVPVTITVNPSAPNTEAPPAPTDGSIHGNITDSFDYSSIDAQVDLGGEFTTYTDGGEYYLDDIPAGTYTLHVSAGGYDPAEYQVEVRAGEESTFDVSLNKSTPARGYIHGTVTDNCDSSPLVANVELDGLSSISYGGYYSFAEITPGTYTLRFSAMYYTSQEHQVEIGAGADITLDILMYGCSPVK